MYRNAIHWDEIHRSRAQFRGVVTFVFGFVEFKVALNDLSGEVKQSVEHGDLEESVD